MNWNEFEQKFEWAGKYVYVWSSTHTRIVTHVACWLAGVVCGALWF